MCSFRHWAAACGAALAVAWQANLWAGTITITSFPPASSGPFTVTSIGIANFGGNDDNSPGPSGPSDTTKNRVNLSKTVTGFSALDVQLPVTNSGGVREYFFTENVLNNTSAPWTGYQLQLGFGLGGSFTASPAGDGLDFDFPNQDPAVSSTPSYSSGSHTQDAISISGFAVPIGGVLQLTFSVDLPDLPAGTTSFTLRQMAVPEPSTIGLLAAGIAGLGLVALRRRCFGIRRQGMKRRTTATTD